MMHRRRRRAAAVVLLQKILMCAICTIALVGLLSGYGHVFPCSRVSDLSDTYKLPTVTQKHEFNYQKLSEKRWMKEEAPPHLSKLQSPPHLFKTPISFHKFDGASGNLNFEKFGSRLKIVILCPAYSLVPIIQLLISQRLYSSSYKWWAQPNADRVYMFYLFSSNFSDVFSEDHSLMLWQMMLNLKKLPKELSFATKVKHFKSGSGLEYYRDTIVSVQDARF
ncbi:O-fucosyltransferase 7-like [Hibiscus syriacus]|uniref:O-fucosyltransferase 7-like n=1 Tax=Hibiscus syriacus TaxID=106335 RepID=UPI0019211E7E|nr:O-fucosyltransferase 7-like [Hibiscus syriacus]